jgi:hypothetical protein
MKSKVNNRQRARFRHAGTYAEFPKVIILPQKSKPKRCDGYDGPFRQQKSSHFQHATDYAVEDNKFEPVMSE